MRGAWRSKCNLQAAAWLVIKPYPIRKFLFNLTLLLCYFINLVGFLHFILSYFYVVLSNWWGSYILFYPTFILFFQFGGVLAFYSALLLCYFINLVGFLHFILPYFYVIFSVWWGSYILFCPTFMLFFQFWGYFHCFLVFRLITSTQKKCSISTR